jgi:2-polyprenyl-3-methyl-5-hydroxy-6-metoxy-1,4-benzoquinol methylase
MPKESRRRYQRREKEAIVPKIPDLTDPRYLHEVGWFLYHDRFRRDCFGGSYEQERLTYSGMLLDEVLGSCQQDRMWLEDKTVVTIGCGCTGDLATWPARVKIAVDPLLYVYQKLGMLVQDAPGTSPTTYLAVGIEEVPLLDDCADLVLCRNALDHVPDPAEMLGQIRRIVKPDGVLYVSVDTGGCPTPDEPTVFSVESLSATVGEWFEILTESRDHAPHSAGRLCAVRILARKKRGSPPEISRDAVLDAYLAQL